MARWLKDNFLGPISEQVKKAYVGQRRMLNKYKKLLLQVKNQIKFIKRALKSNVHFLHIAFSDKPVKFYNLDTIISVGYRVNSVRATQFRIWATNVLKRHPIDGYTLNEKRLKEQTQKLQALQRAVKLIGSMKDRKQLEYKEAMGLL